MVNFVDSDSVKNFKHKDKGKFIEYVQLMYSKDSVLNKIESLEERKRECCRQAGVDYDSNQDMLNLKNEDFQDVVFTYLIQTQSNKFMLLMSSQQLFWNQQKRMMTEYDGKDNDPDKELKYIQLQNTIAEKSHDLLDRIDQLFVEIYKEAETIEMAHTKMRQMVKPEQRVRKLNNV